MKVLLELVGDAARVLSHVDGLGDFRPESRERVRELLLQLQVEAERILEGDAPAGEVNQGRRTNFMQQALEAISTQNYEVARGVLEDAVIAFPEDFEFLNYLGLIAWEQGDLERAERAYHLAEQVVFGEGLEAAQVADDEEPALRAVEGRALCLYRLGDWEQALGYFQWLGVNFPEQYVGCRYLAGEIHHLRGEIDQAIDCYQSVPVEPAVLYNLGLAYFEKDHLGEAIYTLIRAFVANIHVVSFLLGRYAYHKPCTPGYLGSESYAQEFTEACQRLWHQAPGSIHFLEQCFDHTLVRAHVRECGEEGGSRLLQFGDGTLEGDGWLNELQDETKLRQISEQVLRRLRC